jgi:hypothetical protein
MGLLSHIVTAAIAQKYFPAAATDPTPTPSS